MVMKFYDYTHHTPRKKMATTFKAKDPSDKAPHESLLPSFKSSENNDIVEDYAIPELQKTKTIHSQAAIFSLVGRTSRT